MCVCTGALAFPTPRFPLLPTPAAFHTHALVQHLRRRQPRILVLCPGPNANYRLNFWITREVSGGVPRPPANSCHGFGNRPISVYSFPRRALTLCPQLCMGIQPGARFSARSADAFPATLYGHFTQAIYRNRPILLTFIEHQGTHMVSSNQPSSQSPAARLKVLTLISIFGILTVDELSGFKQSGLRRERVSRKEDRPERKCVC
jgi:hypothetical protein